VRHVEGKCVNVGGGGRRHCSQQCGQYFTVTPSHNNQDNESWGACTHGCDFFASLAARTGEKPINSLQNCNYSCDERYRGEFVQACQAGCGFKFDETNNPQPSPRMEEFAPSQEPPRPSFVPLNLDMNGIFQQINQAMPRLNKLVGETFSNPFDDEYEFSLPSLPSLSSLPSLPGFSSRNARKEEGSPEPIFDISFSLPSLSSFPGLGHKDDEQVPMLDNLFETVNQQMSNMMSNMPSLPRIGSLDSWRSFPLAGPDSGAKITVIKAGPGYMEEKHYDVDAEGNIVEVMSSSAPSTSQIPIINDALEHENPLDSNMNESDVEMFVPQNSPEFPDPVENEIEVEPVVAVDDDVEPEAAKPAEASLEFEAEVEPAVVELSEPVAEPQHSIKVLEEDEEMGPFLSVIRNSLQDGERLKELFHRFRALKEAQYRDNYSCNSEHLRWSDWVACVHSEMGVPRWLTAATLALGIIFSVWLCLVIPTAAPRKKIKSLVIKTEKLSSPSAVVSSKELAAAKAAEAKAAEANQEVIAVIKVDIPPAYDNVAPGSPAPSYKSDMLPPMPGSPAPSYKSVDLPAVETKEDSDSLEPVHASKDPKA